MTTIFQLLEDAIDDLGRECLSNTKALDKIRDALYFLAQGHNVNTDVNNFITKYIVPVDVNFEEFKAIVRSVWPEAEQIGRFKDFSHDRVSFHYQTNSYAKAVAYDHVDKCRWTINLGRGCFGRGHTITEALDNERAEALKNGHFTY